jgi:hypothetical protein
MTTTTVTATAIESKPTYLASKNPHSRDSHIHFDEGPHTYTIQGINGVTKDTKFTSVTTWVHEHFEHFDAKKVIAAMMRNTKKWNDPVANAKYYGKTADEIEEMWAAAGREAAAKGTEMHYKIECFYNTPPTTLAATSSTATSSTATSSTATSSTATTVATEPEIRRGGAEPPEFKYFLEFHYEFAATLKPYRTEWTVFHEEARIAGSIDMVYEMITAESTNEETSDTTPLNPHQIERSSRRGGAEPPERSSRRGGAEPPERNSVAGGRNPLVIYDWKRCREIIKTNAGNKFATHQAIEHLPDTNFWHYALQLNIYKYILQNKYGKTVTDLYLIVLHPEAPSYKRIKLPDLQGEVAELFEERIRGFAAAATN